MSQVAFLILSGAYIGPDLIAEFGKIPPSFMPNGTRRLFESQVELARRYTDHIILTLPASYEVPVSDAGRLEALGVELYPSDPEIGLSSAIAAVLRTLPETTSRLLILFGDTLVDFEGTSQIDSFASAPTRYVAAWTSFSMVDDKVRFEPKAIHFQTNRDVAVGFFDIGDPAAFRPLMEDADFFDALNAYAEARNLAPFHPSVWRDFGHLHNYYQSRKSELSTRAFNSITYKDGTIEKTGSDQRKIFAEAVWYRDLPATLRNFVPEMQKIHERDDRVSYELEYIFLTPASELFTFGRLPQFTWLDILDSCVAFLEVCQNTRPRPYEVVPDFANRFFREVIVSKTEDRVRKFAEAEAIDVDAPWTVNGRKEISLSALARELAAAIRPTTPEDICLWHGDFHFANIFYDFRSRSIKLVDPRGMMPDGTLSMFGDARYDIAKLCHSAVGMYDLIVAGRFSMTREAPYSVDFSLDISEDMQATAEDFLGRRIGAFGGGDRDILSLTALLFLAMLPLHNDNRTRQYAMLANAYRLADLARGRP